MILNLTFVSLIVMHIHFGASTCFLLLLNCLLTQAFGEGGAGTWSDGKLTTRIGRNSEPVRFVLETLVKYGAPQRILVEGAPHLGTDNLVRLLRNMREDLKAKGGEIHFGCRASKFGVEDGVVTSVEAEKNDGDTLNKLSFDGLDAVVLATGHSARDVYKELDAAGVKLEPKGFAVGFRIEHPQRIINEIQYGKGKWLVLQHLSSEIWSIEIVVVILICRMG